LGFIDSKAPASDCPGFAPMAVVPRGPRVRALSSSPGSAPEYGLGAGCTVAVSAAWGLGVGGCGKGEVPAGGTASAQWQAAPRLADMRQERERANVPAWNRRPYGERTDGVRPALLRYCRGPAETGTPSRPPKRPGSSPSGSPRNRTGPDARPALRGRGRRGTRGSRTAPCVSGHAIPHDHQFHVHAIPHLGAAGDGPPDC
jgi:hypothetical protein